MRGPLSSFIRAVIGALFVFLISSTGMARAMEITRLDNGLRCIFEKRPGTGVVAVQFWVKVGSGSEDAALAGITHYIEHLIFKGTEQGDRYEIAPRIEALGGTINAFTSYDNTVYHIVVPKNAFETGLELLAGAVRSPLFPEEELGKEKKVVIQEIKMGEDDPGRTLFKELYALSYAGRPYGRPIIGSEGTVSTISRTDILSYFKAHYSIDNVVAVIVGDFDEKRASELLEKQFAGMKPRPARAVKAPSGETAAGGGTKVIERDVKESYLAIAFAIPSLNHDDIPALEVLSKILGEGDSSRLQEELKDKRRLVSNAATYLFTPREDGLFMVVATFKGRDHEAVAKAVDREVRRFAADGVADWEMEKAKNQVKASYVYSAETVQGKAREIGYYDTIAGDPHFTPKYLKKLDRVTAADLKRVLEKYLIGGKWNLVALLPKAASNPATIQLENGLKLVINKNSASPSFSFMIGFVGGTKEEAEGKNGTFNVLSKMLLKGTKGRDARGIARTIDTLAGGMSPVSGRNVFGLSGKFLSKDFDEAIALLAELVTTSSLKEAELKKVKENVLSDIRQRDDEPLSYTFLLMNRLFYEGHPYGKDTLGNAEDVMKLSAKDLRDIYQRYVTPQGVVLAISGDIDAKKMEARVRELFGTWKGQGKELKRLPHAFTSSRSEQLQKEIKQVHMVFSFTGPGLADQDRYDVEVLDAVLSGMGGRIFKKLREENPFAYSTTFFNQMAYETGAMGVYIGTDPRHVKDVDRVVRKEIADIRKNGFTDEEVENAKRYLVGTHYTRMQTNSAMASAMCLDTIYGLKPNFFKVWPERVQKVTKEQVNEAARKYLDVGKMLTLTVGP